MKLRIDNTKSYGIALEGGGAKGAYQIGVWKALREAGIRYHMVAGTSVGALNGALMAMGDYDTAVQLWSDMRLSRVIALDEQGEKELGRFLRGEADISDAPDLLHHAAGIIKNRGLDVAPLREWVRSMVDEEKLRSGGVELYISTVSLTEKKGLEVKINDMSHEEMCDMLLASAYHPSFRLERLGGKLYADGAFVDALPVYPLIKHGCKDIIAVRLPGFGVEKLFRKPEDVNIIEIETAEDLGHVLNFDGESAKRNMEIGYFDALRVLYGLHGSRVYIERSISEEEAMQRLVTHLRRENPGESLRRICERQLPKLSRRLDREDGEYFDIFAALLEEKALEAGVERMRVVTDRELASELGL